MPVTISEKAAAEVMKVKTEQNLDLGVMLRLGIAGGGCGGLSYRLGFDASYDETKDVKYELHGVTVVVDKKSELFLDGATLDFHDGIDRRGFFFENPNAVKSCGCGSSFHA